MDIGKAVKEASTSTKTDAVNRWRANAKNVAIGLRRSNPPSRIALSVAAWARLELLRAA